MGRDHAALAGLGAAMVSAATIIQMYIDYQQSNAAGLENVSLKLKILVTVAFLLTFTGFVLGLSASARRR
ncbi:hypothetical protein [Pyrodictium abyssi]|uniref:Uncharacterized protein n=1 Tax=Pyrodictium abyssi TaxID=54256 RepID=A0ABN6ZLZ4_9CREN|nr:hypothetical protein PABY_08190 [Pyrodictium abyssi]